MKRNTRWKRRTKAERKARLSKWAPWAGTTFLQWRSHQPNALQKMIPPTAGANTFALSPENPASMHFEGVIRQYFDGRFEVKN